MDMDAVPDALRERLGAEAAGGLLQLLDLAHREGRADVIAACTERFERRLVEEVADVRVQLAQVEASLRQEIVTTGAGLRQDMGKMEAGLRQDIGKMELGVRQDLSAGRVELLKWCFLFWIGQVVAITGILGLMLRLFRP